MPTPISVRPPRPIVATPADIADIAARVHRLRAGTEVETQLLLNRLTHSPSQRPAAACGAQANGEDSSLLLTQAIRLGGAGDFYFNDHQH